MFYKRYMDKKYDRQLNKPAHTETKIVNKTFISVKFSLTKANIKIISIQI